MSDIALLEHPVSPKDAIEAAYLDVTVREGIFASGAFQIGLPKLWDWQTSSREPSAEDPMFELATFKPGAPDAMGANHDASVLVHVAFLPRVMNGSDWLRSYMSNGRFDLHAIRELPTQNGLMGDAVASAQDGRLHRLVTVKDADLLYLIDGSLDPMGAASEPALQEIALMAAMRFKLLEPSGLRYAEAMAEHVLDGQLGNLGFIAPASWEAVTPGDVPPQGDAIHLKNLMGEAVAGSLVAVTGGVGSDALTLEETLLGKIAIQGAQLGDAEPILEATRGELAFSAWMRRGQSGGVGATMLCLRADFRGVPSSITVLSPAADAEFASWAVNRRVFEIVLETLTGFDG